MRKIIIAVLIIALIGSGTYIGISLSSDIGLTENYAEYNAGDASAYITLSSNPSVEIIIDENERVIALNALNDEGQIILAERDYYGYPVEEASNSMITTMLEAGYIDIETENGAVYAMVISDDENVQDGVLSKLKANANTLFRKGNIKAIMLEGEIPDGGDTSIGDLATDVAEIDQKLFYLMIKYMQLDIDLEFEDVQTLTRTELLEGICDEIGLYGQLYSDEAKETYKTEREALQSVYQANFDGLFESEANYASYFLLKTELEDLLEDYKTEENFDSIETQAISTFISLQAILDVYEVSHAIEISGLRTTYKIDARILLHEHIDNNSKLQAQTELNALKEAHQAAYNSRVREVNSGMLENWDVWQPVTGYEVDEYSQIPELINQAGQIESVIDDVVDDAKEAFYPFTRTSFGMGDSGTVIWTP